MYTSINEESLQILLQDIEYDPEYFVPVIGPELMVYNIKGKRRSIYELIAEKLANELNISMIKTKPYTINDVINAYYKKEKYSFSTDTPYLAIKKILTKNEWGIPKPVENLAEISHFKFYINATWLPFIGDALKTVNGEEKIIEKMNLIGEELEDIVDFNESKDIIQIYHLFGNAKNQPQNKFGLTDEDILYLSNNLISKCPEKLNSFLTHEKRKLLLFGCDFSSWLIRLIFLSIRKDISFKAKSICFVGTSNPENHSLDLFWHRLSPIINTDKDTIAIVNSFHKAWKEKQEKSSTIKPDTLTDKEFPKNSVFISYDANDLEKAIILYEKLNSRGIHTWLDKEELEPGKYQPIIKYRINKCSVFLPLISINSIANVKRDGFMYSSEWLIAKDENDTRIGCGKQNGYIIPVFIDETSFKNPDLPDLIRENHGYSINDDKLINAIINNIKSYQSNLRE